MVGVGSLAETISAIVEPYLQPALIDHSALTRIEQVSALLPSDVSRFFGFECRLSASVPSADFLCCFSRLNGRSRFIADPVLMGEAPGFPQHSAWQKARDFFALWMNDGGVLAENADDVWLEFDTTGDLPGVPSLFFGTGNPSLPADQRGALIRRGLVPLISDATSCAGLADQVIEVCDRLPDGARVFQVGVMLARGVDGVRLCIRDIPPDSMLTFLAAIRWPGDAEVIGSTLCDLTPHVDRIDIDIDITNQEVMPRLGLECYQLGEREDPAAWSSLFDWLLAEELAIQSKLAAIIAYTGISDRSTESERWPAHLNAASPLMALRALCVNHRYLHHIKLSLDGRRREAKAYLAVAHQWHSLATIMSGRST